MALLPPDANPIDRFIIPPDLVTVNTWVDTRAVSDTTFSKGVWVKNEHGIYALRKPGVSTPNGLEAIRELTCWVIAGWLRVPSPPVKLVEHPTIGACSLCFDMPGNDYRWYNVMMMKLTPDLLARGTVALQDYGGRVVVLDALVGGVDRLNPGNHLFVDDENRWYTIDYGLSFNRHLPPAGSPPGTPDARTGVGDPRLPFGVHPWQAVFPDIIKAIGLNPGPLRDTLALAQSIPDGQFDALLNQPPAAYASQGDRDAMAAFLKLRRANLGTILEDWCNRFGLPGVLRTP